MLQGKKNCLPVANRDLGILRNVMNGEESVLSQCNDLDLVELGRTIQPSFFEVVLKIPEAVANSGFDRKVVPVFDNLVANECCIDIEAECLDHQYVLSKRSSFYMSDLRDVHNLIPAESNDGFSLIVIDPPWENSSAHQKMKYPTLPNRHFLYLPVNQLAHNNGALVALWVTNREKLRDFVDNELFLKWDTKHAATFYWLKVKPDGSMISELDLFHHRPYECLHVGFCPGKEGKIEG